MVNRPIGVFDSGVGGLTVVKELIRQLPLENIVYLGDTARVPYGTKSKSTIVRFTLENILFLLKQNVKLIVIACNTSSSMALEEARNYFKIPIVDVVLPGAKEAVYATKNKRIGVIGTPATIKSRAYEREIKRLNSSIKVISKPTPLFVPLVEEGLFYSAISLKISRMYLKDFKEADIDTLVLGCTHYPLLKPLIQRVMGKNVTLIDSAEQVVYEVKELLKKEKLFNRSKKKGKHKFFVTDAPENFLKVAQHFLKEPIKNIKMVNYGL
ncbi:MAG: glutamate racemase [Candidatus Omnitrophica bacterium]|nr:glutamate racemase [Candidatus Omnitrophota bacterium]